MIADRVDRRGALYVTQSLLLAQAVVLAVLSATGYLAVWHLIACALWLGIVSAFDVPIRQALYVHLVDDRDDLPNAIALNSFLVNGARVVGPAIAGILLSLVSEAVCFALNALSFVAVIVAISRLRWPHATTPERTTESFWSSWKEGARYSFGFAPVRALLVLVAVVAWTITPYSSLMPIYAARIFGGGAHTLGFLLSAAGAGALASTAYLAGRKTIRGLGRVIALAAAVAGIALAAFSHLTVLPAALALMALGRRRSHPRGGVGQHDHPNDRRGPAARPRRRVLHDVVSRRRADRQPRRGRACAGASASRRRSRSTASCAR